MNSVLIGSIGIDFENIFIINNNSHLHHHQNHNYSQSNAMNHLSQRFMPYCSYRLISIENSVFYYYIKKSNYLPINILFPLWIIVILFFNLESIKITLCFSIYSSDLNENSQSVSVLDLFFKVIIFLKRNKIKE